MRYILITLVICSSIVLNGCAPKCPEDMLALSPTSLQERQLQSRKFETVDEVSLLAAGINVLQDMGYTVEETEKDIGLVTCYKDADATDAGQVAGAIFMAALTGVAMSVDSKQKIRVSLVTFPSREKTGVYIARITFQRLIWNTQNQLTKAQTIMDQEIYEAFFDKLSKSVFLEAQKI